MSVDFSSRLGRLLAEDPRSQKEIAEAAGISESGLVNYKKGRKPKADELFRLADTLGCEPRFLLTGEGTRKVHSYEFEESNRESLHEGEVIYRAGSRQIPVVGWAHAGEALDYEQLPEEWQEWIPTECRDPRAFAVRLEGDSMSPDFQEGDLLVLMPEEAIYNGVLAVIRLASGGVLFRRVEMRGERLVLIPRNSAQYDREEFSREDIAWCFPVWGSWRQVWKR